MIPAPPAPDAPAPQPGRRVAIIQSGYLPWKGYFDIIHDVDLFVFLDDVQYTTRDWRSRNRYKSPQGPAWITVPVGSHRDLPIDAVRLGNPAWQAKHWATLRHAYGRSPFFKTWQPLFEDFYLGRTWESLSAMNQYLIQALARDCLGIRTDFLDARPFAAPGRKTPKLLAILEAVGASLYVTGPSTRCYLDTELLASRGIQTVFKDYGGYPAYPQLHPPFLHEVSVVDLLFNTGPEAPDFIWGWRSGGRP